MGGVLGGQCTKGQMRGRLRDDAGTENEGGCSEGRGREEVEEE